MEAMSGKKRVRDDSGDLEFNSAEVKRLKEELLDILDDSNPCTDNQDLDSFMKSFEDEISAKSSLSETVVDLTSESGDSQPDLGYLFEASDVELGLPPSAATPIELENRVETEVVRFLPYSTDVNELWHLDDQIANYDSFGYGFDYADGNNSVEYVAFDELFDYTDLGFV